MTQERLAEKFEMTAAGVQKWLAGTRQPTLEEIDQIAHYLGVPGVYLTHGVKPEDLCTDLPEPARGVIRRLIGLQRDGKTTPELLTTLEAALTLGLRAVTPEKPLGAPIAPEHEAHLRELSEIGEAVHQQRRPGRRLSNR